MKKLTFWLIPCILSYGISSAQADSIPPAKTFEQQDVKDWFHQIGLIKNKKPPKTSFLLVIPVIASNPTAGLLFGGGLTYSYKTKPTDQKLSNASANATYSTKGLLNLNMKTNVFLANERIVANGDWRFLINSETTYGLGTKHGAGGNVIINGIETSVDSLGQPLKYNQVRLHETLSMKVFENFFAGLGIHFDHYYHITDYNLEAGDTVHSFHYNYSKDHGFDWNKYTAFGVSLNLLYDSRDNQVNAYKGYYANVNMRLNPTWLGSTQGSGILLTEYRSFHALDSRNRHILAFWFYGNYVTGGEVPYLLLPALGYDQRQRTGRGYTFGRFRGESMMYGETEYRFPVSRNTGILGGVLFLNATTTSNKKDNVAMFNYIRAGYGAGLRIMLDKMSRSRLQVDVGMNGTSPGFYLGAQETF